MEQKALPRPRSPGEGQEQGVRWEMDGGMWAVERTGVSDDRVDHGALCCHRIQEDVSATCQDEPKRSEWRRKTNQ